MNPTNSQTTKSFSDQHDIPHVATAELLTMVQYNMTWL